MADHILAVDWEKLFSLNMSLVEILIRGTITYIILFFLLRSLRKQSGGMSVSDILVIVLLGNGAQNAMVADTVSITDGMLLAVVIIGWNYFLDYLGFKFKVVGRYLHPPARVLIKNGKIQFQNMQKEFITEEELYSQVRGNGIEEFTQVQEAYLEGNGHISVIKRKHEK